MTKNLTPFSEKKLLAYSAAAGVALSLAVPADASIIYTPVGQTVELGSSFDAGYPFWSAHLSVSGDVETATILSCLVDNIAGDSGYAQRFAPSQSIDSTLTNWGGNNIIFENDAAGDWAGEFNDTTPGYIGIQFEKLGTSDMVFGWIGVDNIASDGSFYRITGWAFEDDGSGIHVGDTGAQVPEPGTLALLAMGVAGLAAISRKKKI